MDDSIDLIERYFEDSLNPEELKKFRLRLETDETFAEAFELEKSLMEGIDVMGNKNLKEDLKVYYKEEIEQKETPAKSRNLSRRIWLSTAASIAALLIAGWWFSRDTPERLYKEYFQPEFNFVEKGNDYKLTSKAESALKTGNYEKALPLLNELIIQDSKNTHYIIAKGIALIETENYIDAFSTFQEAKSINPFAKNEAMWFHGLALLKLGKLEESYNILRQIPKSSARHKKAKELIKKINY